MTSWSGISSSWWLLSWRLRNIAMGPWYYWSYFLVVCWQVRSSRLHHFFASSTKDGSLLSERSGVAPSSIETGKWSLPIDSPTEIVASRAREADKKVRSRVDVLPVDGSCLVARSSGVMRTVFGWSKRTEFIDLPHVLVTVWLSHSELWALKLPTTTNEFECLQDCSCQLGQKPKSRQWVHDLRMIL